jgi:hypothetical protein
MGAVGKPLRLAFLGSLIFTTALCGRKEFETMSEIKQKFRQFGTHDLEQYLFLSTPNDWGDAVLDGLVSKVSKQMEERLRQIPPEYLSDSEAFYLLMRKVFQFTEGAIWQHAFSQMGGDQPEPSVVAQSLAEWFDNYLEAENRIVREFMFDSLERYRIHGDDHPIRPHHIVKIATALRNGLAEHFRNGGIPDVPELHEALRELKE